MRFRIAEKVTPGPLPQYFVPQHKRWGRGWGWGPDLRGYFFRTRERISIKVAQTASLCIRIGAK